VSSGSGLSDCWFSTRSSHGCLAHRCQIERKAKADQPILVGQDKHPDRTRDDPIHQGQVIIRGGALIRVRAMRASVGLRGPRAATCWEPPLLARQTHLSCAWAQYSTNVRIISTTWSASLSIS